MVQLQWNEKKLQTKQGQAAGLYSYQKLMWGLWGSKTIGNGVKLRCPGLSSNRRKIERGVNDALCRLMTPKENWDPDILLREKEIARTSMSLQLSLCL